MQLELNYPLFLIDFPIPGNDDSRRSISLYCSLIKETINSSHKDIKFEDTKDKNSDNKSDNHNIEVSTDNSKPTAKSNDGIN